ncbi:MAG: T9SS type A sorting domain-containing protein, partial [Fibrobacteres bacterium]|nr:T9SS type A sorting domain-containing protein [Fibrobacterota bacterium]
EVGVSYSDDNGATWSTAKMGFGPIEGSRQAVWYAGNYDMPETHIVPYKEHAAVFWQDARGLLWSVFNGTDWSTPEVIETNGWLSGSLKYAVHAVSMGQNEIFVTDLKMNGILHWNGSAWIRELSNVPGGGQLSVCGDGVNPENDRLIYFTVGDGTSKKPLLAYRRTATGSWEAPLNVSRDSIQVDTYNGWIGISAQPYSPPNFAPVAWSADSVIKMVKVPPADYTPSTASPIRTAVKNILSNSINITPNPVNMSAYATITAGRGIVKIFSADGKVVFSRTVQNERETILWSTKGLSSGVYLISLNAGDTKVSKHMTLMR